MDRWSLKSVVIDLGGTKSINSIKGTFLTSSSAGAGQPTMVCTFASMDGTNWMPMSRTSIIDQWSSGIHTYGWHVSNTNGLYTDLSWDDNSVYRAKYVRFDFQTRGLNLIDEIEVTGVDGRGRRLLASRKPDHAGQQYELPETRHCYGRHSGHGTLL